MRNIHSIHQDQSTNARKKSGTQYLDRVESQFSFQFSISRKKNSARYQDLLEFESKIQNYPELASPNRLTMHKNS